MAVTAHASGTQTCTIGTEHFLSSPNVAGVFELLLDLNALAAGDVLEVRAYKMVLTGGTSRVALFQVFIDAQPDDGKVAISEPVSNELTDTNAVRFSIKQTRGTGRSIPWVVLKHA
jgi:hypothetical protein